MHSAPCPTGKGHVSPADPRRIGYDAVPMRLPAPLLALLLPACAGARGVSAAGVPAASTGCGLPEPRGHLAQYTWHPAADPPLRCEGAGGYDRGWYIRVAGTGPRMLGFGRGAAGDPACNTPDADPVACPIVQVDPFGMDVLDRVRAAVGEGNADGMGLGLCGTTGSLDDWNLSIRVHDWRHADAAVAIVAERLAAWGLGGEFGVSVSGISCAVAL